MGDFQRALDFFEASERASSLDDLQIQMSRTLLNFGVTQYSLVALADGANGARTPIALSRATNRDWSERYHARGYFNSDVVIHEAIRRSAPFTWEELEPSKFSSSAKTVFEEGRDTTKASAGLVVPIHDAQGFAGCVSLFFPDEGPNDAMRGILKLVAIYGMDKAKALHGVTNNAAAAHAHCPLSARQREALSFLAMGKTDWEIGSILGVASRTVEHHVNAAKRVLNVATRAQAVAAAVHRGWVAL